MRLLIVTAREDGGIAEAAVHDVQNPDRWAADGGMILEDGLCHLYPAGALLFEVGAETPDVVGWARQGKYYVADGALYEAASWTPPPDGAAPGG